MSSRLDQQREKELEPKRLTFAYDQIQALGLSPTKTDKSISFEFKGSQITLYPYSGWFSGKTVNDGRGIENLLGQLKA